MKNPDHRTLEHILLPEVKTIKRKYSSLFYHEAKFSAQVGARRDLFLELVKSLEDMEHWWQTRNLL